MKPERYAQETYRRYVEVGFGGVHGFSEAEYELYARYFRKNYQQHLPADREALILDVACGAGQFLYYLRKGGYTRCLGIDLSDQCLQQCTGLGLNVEKADAFEYLRDRTGRYDAVVCNELFEHLDKDRALELAGLCREALEDDGVLLAKAPNMACPVVAVRTRYNDLTHETGFTDHSFRQLLLLSGFEDVRVVGTDIYVTRNPLANVLGRLAFRCVTALFRGLYYLYGIKGRHVMTKSILAIARKH